MIIIDKSKEPSPRFIYKPVPENMTPKEKELYWGKEHERWNVGFKPRGQEMMDGLLYFYLTIINLITPMGKMIKPIWRDVEELVVYNYRQAEKKSIDAAYFKRRRMGLSSFFGAGVPLYQFFTKPGSTSLMTSADKERTKLLYTDKLLPAYENLHPDIFPNKKTRTTGGMELQVAMRELGAYFDDANVHQFGKPTKNLSSCKCRQTSDRYENVANFEGKGAVSLFIDELFLHPFAAAVVASNQATMMDDLVKTGPIIMGGSAGVVDAEGLKEAKRIWSMDERAMVKTFIPGWMGVTKAPEYDSDGFTTGKILNFCPNGHSNEKAATEYILRERDRLKKFESEEKQIGWKKSYPLTIEDILEYNTFGVIPEDIAPRLAKQETFLINNPQPIRNYFIIERNGKPEAVMDKKGPWTIVEHPVDNSTYGMGTDPIPMVDKAAIETKKALDTGARSVSASLISRKETNSPVAYYLNRTQNPAEIIHDLKAAQMYYRGSQGCLNMIERNRGGELIREYETTGNELLLAKQPIVFGPLNMDKKRLRGYDKNIGTTDTIHRIFFDALRNGVENLRFPYLIEQILLFLKQNTDLVDAYISVEILFEDMRTRARGPAGKNKLVTKRRVYTTWESGVGIVQKVHEWTEFQGNIVNIDHAELDEETQRMIRKQRTGVGVMDTRG